MKEDFISFELAKKLREKGYHYESRHIYDVLKWLREEKGLYIRPSVYFIGWCYDITTAEGKRLHGTECEYYSYEETVNAGIEYAVDNLI